MNHFASYLLSKAAMAQRLLPSLSELMAKRAPGLLRESPWRAGALFRRPLVLLRGPVGQFWARHAGYQLGDTPMAMFHAVEDIPGLAQRGTQFGADQLQQAGFRLPKIVPYETWSQLKQL